MRLYPIFFMGQYLTIGNPSAYLFSRKYSLADFVAATEADAADGTNAGTNNGAKIGIRIKAGDAGDRTGKKN